MAKLREYRAGVTARSQIYPLNATGLGVHSHSVSGDKGGRYPRTFGHQSPLVFAALFSYPERSTPGIRWVDLGKSPSYLLIV